MIRTETRLACQDEDILWAYEDAIDDREPGIEVAIAHCAGCPVSEACYQHGLTTHAKGVFGGRLLGLKQYQARKGVCLRGHDISGENGRLRRDGRSRCLICEAEGSRRRKLRRAS